MLRIELCPVEVQNDSASRETDDPRDHGGDGIRGSLYSGRAFTTYQIALIGDVDAYTSVGQLEPVMRQVFVSHQAHSLILNLSRLEFMDSSGFSVLLNAHRTAVGRGGKVVIASPLFPVARSLGITGLDRVIPVAETMEQAKILLESGK